MKSIEFRSSQKIDIVSEGGTLNTKDMQMIAQTIDPACQNVNHDFVLLYSPAKPYDLSGYQWVVQELVLISVFERTA